MKKRILSTILSLCMALTMVMSLLPPRVLAVGLPHSSHAGGQDTALPSIAVQNIGPTEAEVENDLHEKMSAQVSVITLISDIELSGYLPIDYEVTIDLNGHVLKMADDARGSVIVVGGKGHLTLIDSNPDAPHKFKVDGTNSWVLDETDGTETVCGGIITGGTGFTVSDYSGNGINDDNSCGGGVLIESGGKLTMTGGHIVGCTATGNNAFGGGVFVSKNGTFTMSGGSITGCAAVTQRNEGCARGGGVRSAGITTLSGTAVIRDCHAKGAGKGVYDLSGGGLSDGHVDGKLFISGNVKIIGCTADGYRSDAMFIINADNRSITGGMFYGSINTLAAVDGLTVTYKLNGAHYAVQVLQSGPPATKPDEPAMTNQTFDGWYTADGTKWDFTTAVTENITLTGELYAPVDSAPALESALADDTAKVIRLTKDIDIGKDLTVDRTVTLDLNGHVLRYSDANRLAGQINVTGNLTLTDSNPDAEHRFSTPYGAGLWILDETNGDKIAKGGIITACIVDVEGGTFTMNAGSIIGSQGGTAGAVAVKSGGKFIMNAGVILGCYCGGSGAVYAGSSTFTMNGGSIKECDSNYGFWAVNLLSDATMNANGGEVEDLIYLEENSKITGSAGATGVTVFRGELRLTLNSTVERGIYYGDFTIWSGSKIDGITVTYLVDGAAYAKQVLPRAGLATRPDDPADKKGYFFGGWCKSDGAAWDYATDTVTADITLTAKWTACDHSGHTGAQPTCTGTATCTACGGTINALGHDWGAWVSNGDDTHTRTCKRGGAHTETKDCFGGEATCKAAAVCDVCGKAHGSRDPDNHKNGKQVWTKTETTHEQKWDCCGAVTVANAAHEWENGKCTVCSYACQHADDNNDHICDLCSKVISNHADADNNHVCDLCKKVISNHADTDNNHVCDLCKKVISNHADADNNHVCDLCKKVISNHADADNNHVCDLCKKVISNHADADNDHICDICDKVISNHMDGNNDHICDLCKKVISNHTGGVATCKERALCEICQNAFGACDPNHHTNLAHFPAKAAAADAEGNIEYWYCDGCDRYFADKDGKYPIEKGDTVTKKLPPRIISGNGAAVTQGEKTALPFASDAAFSDFIRAELNGETLDEKYYDKKAGSTIITLHADYVATLSAGEHTLSIVSQSGTATATFTVAAKPAETPTGEAAKPAETPTGEAAKTGDSHPSLLWILLLFVSGGVLTGATVGLRKKKHPAK